MEEKINPGAILVKAIMGQEMNDEEITLFARAFSRAVKEQGIEVDVDRFMAILKDEIEQESRKRNISQGIYCAECGMALARAPKTGIYYCPNCVMNSKRERARIADSFIRWLKTKPEGMPKKFRVMYAAEFLLYDMSRAFKTVGENDCKFCDEKYNRYKNGIYDRMVDLIRYRVNTDKQFKSESGYYYVEDGNDK